MMKKIFTIFLLLLAVNTMAQNNRTGLGLSYLVNDYYSLQTGEFTLFLSDDTSTFNTYDHGIRFSYWKELSRWFDFSANLNYSRVDLPNAKVDSNFILRRWNNYSPNRNYLNKQNYQTSLVEIDARVNFNILDKSMHTFIPYLFAGITAANDENWGFDVPSGIGMHVNLSDKLSINAEASRRSAISKIPEQSRNQFALGLIWWTGGKAREKQPVVVDTDGDGVADDVDKCPAIAGLSQFSGCPDTDGDGIPDNLDKCPTVPGTEQYGGCAPTDSDGDGIPDDVDKCPNEKGIAKYGGCPIPDTDGDGFNDEVDKCPKIPSEINNGCPVVSQEVKEKIELAASNVHFQSGKAILTEDSDENLDIIADLLRDNPDYTCDIKGYTDNSGSDEINVPLSEKRAKVCYDYLINKGISADRLSYKGYGSQDPVASNDTPEGRAKNRRTEFKLDFKK